MMKVFISGKFGYLKEWIYDIASNDALPQGKVLRDKRNSIVRCIVGNEAFVVKRFGRPNPFNRIVYSFFRRTKAERSYRNTEKLCKMGYDSPEPVAYIELRSFGVFGTGYYICRWSPNPTIAEMPGGGRCRGAGRDYERTGEIHGEDAPRRNLFLRLQHRQHHLFARRKRTVAVRVD